MDRLNDYDYDLPGELIARTPPERRDAARLMVLNRDAQTITHQTIGDLPNVLAAGDCLVLNDTQVIPARLLGARTLTGGKWEGLFLGTDDSGNWRVIGQTRGKLQAGESVTLRPAHYPDSTDTYKLQLISRDDQGTWTVEPQDATDPHAILQQFGTVPLPPYINRVLATEDDWQRYQTTYARRPGAVAAPTAGLHFTPELLQGCTDRGIRQAYVTLHVGVGTFRPISVERLDDHQMHSEWCQLPAETAGVLDSTRKSGHRVVSVGTTSMRTLESAVRETGSLETWEGETDIFIRPPYRFGAVDALLTNFHLPRSTLFVLVCAFAGTDFMQQAYQEAVRERYRFFSYGDAMLIL